jgi:hypothetical protein
LLALALIRIRIRIFLGSQNLDLGELFDIFQAQHDLKNIDGVTVKFKSGVTAIWREIAHLTIIGSGSGHFSDPKIGSRCVTCRARNRIQIFTEAASNT